MGCSNQATNDALHPTFLAHLQGHGLQWKAKDELRFPDCEGTQETEEGSELH